LRQKWDHVTERVGVRPIFGAEVAMGRERATLARLAHRQPQRQQRPRFYAAR